MSDKHHDHGMKHHRHFKIKKHHRHGRFSARLKYFNFDEPLTGPSKVVMPTNLAQGIEVQLATIRLNGIRPNDRIELEATVGWNLPVLTLAGTTPGINLGATLDFKIRRGSVTGPVIFETEDSASSLAVILAGLTTAVTITPPAFPVTTSFTAVDTGVVGHHMHHDHHHHHHHHHMETEETYVLTVTLVTSNVTITGAPTLTAANIIGPIVFDGKVIDENEIV